jgi:hypothetical protein
MLHKFNRKVEGLRPSAASELGRHPCSPGLAEWIGGPFDLDGEKVGRINLVEAAHPQNHPVAHGIASCRAGQRHRQPEEHEAELAPTAIEFKRQARSVLSLTPV